MTASSQAGTLLNNAIAPGGFATSMKSGQLAGAIILSIAFGSLHAFSVLSLPIENAYGVSRAGVSLGYALAILSLTGAVYVSPMLMRRLSPSTLALFCGAGAAAGLAIAGSGLGLASFLGGYGVIFGFSNGLAYSLFLDRAADATARQKGFAIGLVTATYGGGAALFAPVLATLAAASSVFVALVSLALIVLASGLAAAFLFGSARFEMSRGDAKHEAPRDWLRVMWALYFAGVLGSLMIIAHAAPLMEARHSGTGVASLAVMLIACGNIAGSICGGWWSQSAPPSRALALPLTLGIFGAAMLLVSHAGVVTLVGFAVVGIAYGGLIAAIPVVVMRNVGSQRFAHAFARIFSAWGLAGLTGPLLAGVLYDQLGSYTSSLMIAILMSFIALALAPSSQRAKL
jgi:MFS transporter, OFA family, oxalate/formate antiporter